jgi:hypothetical protein
LAIARPYAGGSIQDPGYELRRIPLLETVWKVPIGLDSECSE